MLRLYRYVSQARSGTGCQAHADLGLLTLSPCPTLPGLLVHDVEGLCWTDAEVGMVPEELTVFAGEQLSFLSGGAVHAPLSDDG